MAKFFVLLVCSLLAATFAANDYTNYTKLDGENYKLWWRFENKTDTFYFKVEVKALGWIGFGFTLLNAGPNSWMRNAMMKYDVLVAGVKNGVHYSEDYLTAYLNQSQAEHIDKKNNWEITSAKEEGGKTILEFNRKRKTDDPMEIHKLPFKGDIEITPGERNFVWAYHDSIDTAYLNDTAYKHTRSGLQAVVLLKEEPRETIYITREPPQGNRVSKASSLPGISTFTFFLGSLFTVITACFL